MAGIDAAPGRDKRIGKYAVLAVKLAISVVLIALALRTSGFAAAIAALGSAKGALGIVGACALLCVQSILAGVRQVKILALFGATVTFAQSLKAWLSGLFVGQVFVTFIAGDVVRALQLATQGIPARAASQAVALDRLLGFGVLLAMVLGVVPFLLPLAQDPVVHKSLFVLAALSVAGIAALAVSGLASRLFSRFKPGGAVGRVADVVLDIASVFRFIPRSPLRSCVVVALGLVMHLLNSCAIGVLAVALGVPVSPVLVGMAAIPALLLSMLPISFAGWGVREAAMISGLGLLGIAPDAALAVSMGFGAALLLSSLPGIVTVLELFRMRRANSL